MEVLLKTSENFTKGFNPTLYDAIDTALVSVLGKEATSTFYYHIRVKHGLSEKELKERPLEVLQYMEELLGKAGFAVLTPAILVQIAETFSLEAKPTNIKLAIEQAKKNYLVSEL